MLGSNTTNDTNLGEHYRTMKQYIADGKRRLWIELARLRLRYGSDAGPLSRPPSHRSLPAEPTILFLCFGNICRSPMAERYLKNELEAIGYDGVTVDSAGFVEQDGRSSPEPAIEAAREYDVALSDHRAKRTTREMVETSDLIFVMDMYNYHDMKHEFADAMEKVYFLKPAGGGDTRRFEISDPHNDGIAAFRAAYGEVTDAIDGVVETLRGDGDR